MAISVLFKTTALLLLCATGHSIDTTSNSTGGIEGNPPKCVNIAFAARPWAIYDYNNDNPYQGVPYTSEINYYLFDTYGNQILSSNATTNRICHDDKCQYLLIDGHGLYIMVDDMNNVLYQGEVGFKQPKLIRMGDCMHHCDAEEQQLVLLGEEEENPNLYDFGRNPAAIKEILFDEDQDSDNIFDTSIEDATVGIDEVEVEVKHDNSLIMKTMCLNPTGCYKLIGSAVYMLSTVDSMVEEGTTYGGYSTIGATENCYQRCDDKPLLVETRRGQEITLALSSISGMSALTDVNSPQYLAACWLIHDDLRQLTSSDSNIIQRYILALLYYTLRGPQWKNNYDFLSFKSECEWTKWTFFDWLNYYFRDGNGVLCNDSGEVSKIILAENGLYGTLPPEISWLTQVDFLEFSQNAVYGSIPNEVGHLTNLEKIRFRVNGLTGNIPQSLSQIESLALVDFGNNMLEGGLLSIPRPCNLYAVDLRNNMISGSIPNEIGTCTSLGVLNLNYNFVTGTIPQSIGDLIYLERVNLQRNLLNGPIPSNILTLSHLTTFWVAENALSGRLPNNVSDSSSINALLVDHNHLTGTIPPEFSLLKGLQYLYLQNNELTGEIPRNFTELERLSVSFFQNNEITGTAPFETCEQFVHLEADCGSPERVSCTCCSDCHGIFKDVDDGSACPSRELNIQFEGLSPGYNINFMLEYVGGGIIDNYRFAADAASHTYSKCISTSSCFNLVFDDWTNVPFEMTVSVNEKVIAEELVTIPGSPFIFGYSSSEGGGIAKDTCESFEMCNMVLESNSTKRELINRLTRITGIEVLNNTESPYYKAACEWVKFLDTKSEEESAQSKLLQHYILALIYFITNGEEWHNSDSWLTDEPFCSWYGISCDSYEIITIMDLSSNNLVGTLPTEIAELRGIEQLVLSNNYITGTIPLEIGKLRRLKQLTASRNTMMGNLPSEIGLLSDIVEVDLSSNQLAGTIPTEIGELDNIQVFNLRYNTFSGEIPESFYSLTDLKHLSLGANLFAGDASGVGRFLNLELLDLSDNFFTGSIPLNGNLKNIQVLRLSGNRFEGSIPMTIGQMQMLEEIFLFGNELTGNLPSELGNLEGLKQVSLSYNSIKGSIPSEFGKLRNLTLLHLHSNQIEGEADFFDYAIEQYITDCGNTHTSPASVDCISCTSCCNDDGDCLEKSITWPSPGDVVSESPLEPRAFVFLMTLGASFTLVFFLFIVSIFCGKYSTFSCVEFQDQSTYRFLLSGNIWAKSFALLSVLMQLFLLSIFIDASDFTSERNDWEYSTSCPHNSIECEDKRGVSSYAWLAFSFIMFSFLMKDIVEGTKMIYESIILKSCRGIFAGFVVIYVTIASIEAAVLYNYSTGISSTDILKDAVILLFLNEIDEQLYAVIRTVSPAWVEERDKHVKKWLKKEIRTVRKSGLLGMVASDDADEESNLDLSSAVGSLHGPMRKRDSASDKNTENYLFQQLELEVVNLTKDHFSMRTNCENEISNLKIKNEELENKYASLENKHDSLETKNASLENEHALLESKYASLEKNHASLENEHSSLAKKHASLENKHASLEKEILELKRNLIEVLDFVGT